MALLSNNIYFPGEMCGFFLFYMQMHSEYQCLFSSNKNVDVCQHRNASGFLSTFVFPPKQHQVLFLLKQHCGCNQHTKHVLDVSLALAK